MRQRVEKFAVSGRLFEFNIMTTYNKSRCLAPSHLFSSSSTQYSQIPQSSVSIPLKKFTAVLVISLPNHGPQGQLQSDVLNSRHEWARCVQNITLESRSMMLIVTFSYTGHRWHLEMAQSLDDCCGSNGTLFNPGSDLPHLQTCLPFLKPSRAETVRTSFRHSDYFSNKLDDSRIIRVITIIPSFAVICFLCVWLDGSPAPYITPGRDIGEALPMAAFFLLMSTYVATDERNRIDLFAEMAPLDKKGYVQGGGSLGWYRVRFFAWPETVEISTNSKIRNSPSASSNGCQSASYYGSPQLSAWLREHTVSPRATFISRTYGSVCHQSSITSQLALTTSQISIIRTISTIIAITALLGFYKRFKSVLKPRGAFKQLLCFKFIVILNFLQTLIFSFLHSSGDLHANKYLTSNDLTNGLPSLILCCEMALISPFFLMVYSIKPYTIGHMFSPENPSSRHGMHHFQGGPLGVYAILQAINVFDIVIELLKGTRAKFGRVPMQP